MDEYEIHMTVRARSTLDAKKLKQLLVIALLDDLTMIPDGATDELEVVEYDDITVEEVEDVHSHVCEMFGDSGRQ